MKDAIGSIVHQVAKKISPGESGEKYVDGLVSTGKINSLHNINNNFY
jgi:hypothetical protein